MEVIEVEAEEEVVERAIPDRNYLYVCHEGFGSTMKVLAYSPGNEQPKLLSL
jgi:hypothetical protein